jgi:hypothetical protein
VSALNTWEAEMKIRNQYLVEAFILGLSVSPVWAQGPAAAQPVPDSGSLIELSREIRQLRSDLREIRIERKLDTVTALEHMLIRVRADISRIRDEQQAIAEQVAQLDTQLTGQLTPEERVQLETLRAALTDGPMEHSRSIQSAELKHHETELDGRLRQVQQDIRQLRNQTPTEHQ